MFQNQDMWVRGCESDWVTLSPTDFSVLCPFLPTPATICPIVPSAPNSTLIHLWVPSQVHRAIVPLILLAPSHWALRCGLTSSTNQLLCLNQSSLTNGITQVSLTPVTGHDIFSSGGRAPWKPVKIISKSPQENLTFLWLKAEERKAIGKCSTYASKTPNKQWKPWLFYLDHGSEDKKK